VGADVADPYRRPLSKLVLQLAVEQESSNESLHQRGNQLLADVSHISLSKIDSKVLPVAHQPTACLAYIATPRALMGDARADRSPQLAIMCLLTNFAIDVKLGVLTQAASSSQMYEIIAKAFDFPTYEEVQAQTKKLLEKMGEAYFVSRVRPAPSV